MRQLRERAGHALLLGAALAASAYLGVFHLIGETRGRPYVATAVEQLIHWGVLCAIVVAIIGVIEATRLRGAARIATQAAALLAGTVLGALAIVASMGESSQFVRMGIGGPSGLAMHLIWTGCAAAALMSWYYGSREKSQRMVRALRSAEIERQHVRKRLLESRLQVLEAQVEPRFLHDTLAQVQALYAIEHGRAERLLDDLIEYLCAALPPLREGASTLAREAELVSAYLRVLAQAPHALHAELPAIEPDWRGEYAPPMVLLPMVQVAAEATAAARGAGCVSVSVQCTRDRAGATVEFDAAPAWRPGPRIDDVRATIETLFGREASVEHTLGAQRATLRVSWPRPQWNS